MYKLLGDYTKKVIQFICLDDQAQKLEILEKLIAEAEEREQNLLVKLKELEDRPSNESTQEQQV